MTTNENIKPLVDKLLLNPLQFKQATEATVGAGERISSQMLKNPSYIVIGKKHGTVEVPKMAAGDNAGEHSDRVASVRETPKKQVKSMAEALANYTAAKGKRRDQLNKKLAVDQELHSDVSSDTDASEDVFHEAKDFINGGLKTVTSSAVGDGEATATYSADEDLGEDLGAPVATEDADQKGEEKESYDDDDDEDDQSFELEDDNDDNKEDDISRISDSEKVGLLEESMAFEIEKEKMREENKRASTALPENKPEETVPEEDRDDENELKHKTPTSRQSTTTLKSTSSQTSLDSAAPDLSNFYAFNENENDEGSALPSKIVKNWGRDLSSLKPRGLLNHGVTCYTNAAVQAMLHIPAIQHYLFDILRGKYSDTISPTSVSTVLAETSRRMWFPNEILKKKIGTYIDPNKLICRLDDINCMMSEWQQEDSHEYFMSLMSRLQEDSVPKGHKMTESIIYDIFGGLLKQAVTCKSCGSISKTEQPFYDLSLHLKGKNKSDLNINSEANTSNGGNTTQDSSTTENGSLEVGNGKAATQQVSAQAKQLAVNRKFSIEKSIKDFFNPELIRVDNEQKGYVCEKCHKTTNAAKRNSILRAPETLLVHLKKFRFNGTSSSKMKQAVSYPMFLDLTKYCDKEATPKGQDVLPVKYQLISVVVHEGRSLSSGHYIAHCKQPDGSWSTYDDEYINKITERDVLRESNAYYLVYTRLTSKAIKLRDDLSSVKSMELPTKKNIASTNGNGNGNDQNVALQNLSSSPNTSASSGFPPNGKKSGKKWKKNKKRRTNNLSN
ncbi:ubiquitin-specific protease UBP10 KNAG_0F01220 [Huiozyma naganishii CBS 8797]|uniref:ubiquitinyl hydrolase 1 n=1 Tax=Huiozyma naganishii (strain ATCC MYA-139 / BCRC 22969 / CBS 8797 / KCTC 17520 / NBRC 10181 / NCYC 3082 / Yp74L-3) TaxID=1071383 RepID=J7R7E5_HUIN7|nr:hypothetical protein KNAG_0F01220 [Kazachstania naganishii CBS 8797]CCK70790.1 hypothetical protein KNAG_0F01220 [Kazachstania naganishii CBS 8797]